MHVDARKIRKVQLFVSFAHSSPQLHWFGLMGLRVRNILLVFEFSVRLMRIALLMLIEFF